MRTKPFPSPLKSSELSLKFGSNDKENPLKNGEAPFLISQRTKIIKKLEVAKREIPIFVKN